MKIGEGVEMLELSTAAAGRPGTVNPVLLWDDKTMIIIITHHDIDHIGGLSAILEEHPGAAVFAHEAEKPYINGEKNR